MWGQNITVNNRRDPERLQRGGAPALDMPYLAAEWEEDGEAYQLRVLYSTAPRALSIVHWHALKELWEPVPLPPGTTFLLDQLADHLHLDTVLS